jgi:hypothetical protein
MAGVKVSTLGITLLVFIVLYIAYIFFLRGEGFVTTVAQSKASDHKEAAIVAKQKAAADKQTANKSAIEAASAQTEVERLQKLADSAVSKDKSASQKRVTAAAEVATIKVVTAEKDRDALIASSKDSAEAAAKYAKSALDVLVESKKTYDDAKAAKDATVKLNKVAKESLELAKDVLEAATAVTRAVAKKAVDDADKSVKDTEKDLEKKNEDVTNTEKQYLLDKRAAEDAEALSEAAAKFAEESKKDTSSKKTRKSKNNPSVNRDLTKPKDKSSTSSSSTTSSSTTTDDLLSSSSGGFLGALFGSFIGTAAAASLTKNKEESKWTRGGPSPNRRYSDYTDTLREYNDYDPDSVLWPGKNIDTCNLHSVDCNNDMSCASVKKSKCN